MEARTTDLISTFPIGVPFAIDAGNDVEDIYFRMPNNRCQYLGSCARDDERLVLGSKPTRTFDVGQRGRPVTLVCRVTTIPKARDHVFHDCKRDGHVGNKYDGEILYCYVCEGGLSGCVVCNQWEADLTKECPGPPSTQDKKE